MPRGLITSCLLAISLTVASANATQVLPTLQTPDPVFKKAQEKRAVPFCHLSGPRASSTSDNIVVSVLNPLRTLGNDIVGLFQGFFTDYSSETNRKQAMTVTDWRHRNLPSDTVWQAGHERLCN